VTTAVDTAPYFDIESPGFAIKSEQVYQARERSFEGLDIAAGTTVHLFSQSAGTDPRAFPERRFDIDAEREPHFGFGGGAHHCLGHFVARSDMSEEALPLLARRLVDPRPDGTPEFLPDSGNTGPVTLPIAFTPAP
jgi:cytochrome P450